MIMKLKVPYLLLACLIALFSGCDSLIYENQEELEKSIKEQDVYLSVSRIQTADTETINEDATDFEDRVHDLALLVFDSSTGMKVCEYFDSEISFSDKEKTFTVKMTTGQRDFYFVANMPMATLKAINNKSEMIAYMSTFHDLDITLYKGATENKGFPMSRVYLNQTINEGGNIYSPKPFQPITSEVSENRAKLIRAVAKLEVVLDGASINSGVKNIYYKNAYRQFGLTPDKSPATIFHYESNLLKKVGNSYIYYMPEAMMMDTNPVWPATNHKPINYFLIETLEGAFYEIPIITDNRTISETDYMTFATGQNSTDRPDYNIYRNRHYYYLIKKLQTIEISYTIEPWTIEQTSTYMGYGYNVNVGEGGKIRVTNTVDACAPHSIKMKTVSSFTFDDGTVEKVFDNNNINAYSEYTLNHIPKTGDGAFLELYYNNTKVKVFSK